MIEVIDMINPYSNIQWATVNHVMSCSHEHCESQNQFNVLVANSGIQHIAISNYYPSEPVYPLSEKFSDTSGFIASPNAEHHTLSVKNISLGRLHINGLGSFFTSGKPRGETPVGCDYANVSEIIPKIIDDLQYDDGGGVTINHPFWSKLTPQNIMDILDVDERVLGVEIFNSFREHYTDDVLDESLVENIALWDAVLLTGRRCWCFCVADHQGQITTNWEGRNILLVPEITEHNCLKAYRNGEFYGQIGKTNLAFSNISMSENTYTVEAVNCNKIDIVIDGTYTEYSGSSVSITVPKSAIYIRAEAHSSDDSVFSNPIILKPIEKKKHTIMQQIIMMFD